MLRKESIRDAEVEGAKIKDAAVIASKLATDSVETDKILDGAVTPAKLSFAPGAVGVYVPRRVAVPDFTHLTHPTNNALHIDGLDLSAIVPAGAIGVVLKLEGTLGTAGDWYFIYTNQTDIENSKQFANDEGVRLGPSIVILPIDPDLLLDYRSGETIGGTMTYGISVQGWFI